MMLPVNVSLTMSLQSPNQPHGTAEVMTSTTHLSELIAQTPLAVRDQSRLLVVQHPNNSSTNIFMILSTTPSAGDVLVINTSKVIKARLHGTKPTGGKIVFY